MQIESDLLSRAIDENFDRLLKENPKLDGGYNLRLLKNIFGHGFVMGAQYGTERVGKLSASD